MEQQNGKQFLSYRWLVGVLIAIVSFLIVFLINDINVRVKQIEFEYAQGFERISALEAQWANLEKWLTRMESKLDRVIEQK